MRSLLFLPFFAAAVHGLTTSQGAGAGSFPQTHYGYVNVDSAHGANMFYGIRGDSNSTFRAAASTPLVVWLQGGPGATSQFGNFLENGPEKLYLDKSAPGGFALKERVHRWTRHANMLYIDNPVGTGFSYVESPAGYTKTDEQIGDELVAFMEGFLVKHTEYKNRDFWIFCESYGGKMTAYFGAALAKRQKRSGSPLAINFKGVSIGDGWVDPVACMKSYGPYLQTVSQLTPGQVKFSNQMADYAQDALEEGNGTKATQWWGTQQDYLGLSSNNVNWYNWGYYYDYTADTVLNTFLATNFTRTNAAALNASHPYNQQDNAVWKNLNDAFMHDGVSQIDYMLNLNYSVNVEGGQMDLIVDIRCTEAWMQKLSWAGLPQWLESGSTKKALYPGNRLPADFPSANSGGFRQKYKNLALWQIMKAGHMIPLDNPVMAETMFAMIIGGDTSIIPFTGEDGQTEGTAEKTGLGQSVPAGKKGTIHMHKSTQRLFKP